MTNQVGEPSSKGLSGDEVITVLMPRRDYEIMRQMIEDRKVVSRLTANIKTFTISIAAVIGAWFFLGDKLVGALKIMLGVQP